MSTTTLSTVINTNVKKAITQYCKEKGMKLRHLIETALIEKLEDEADIEDYYQRQNEETYPLEEVLKSTKKKK